MYKLGRLIENQYVPMSEDVLKGSFALILSTAKHLSAWLKPSFFVEVDPRQNGKIIPSGTFKTSSQIRRTILYKIAMDCIKLSKIR